MMRSILLMYIHHRPGREHIRRLQEIAPGFRIEVADSEDKAVKVAPDAEVIVGQRYLRQSLPHAPGLKFVQSSSGGVDQLPWQDLKSRGILLARSDFPSKVIAQHAFMLAWALIRRLPDCLESQRRKEWDPAIEEKLLPWPKTALVLGLGSIGQMLTGLLKAAGITVWGVNTRGARCDQCDRVLDQHSWRECIPETDILFLTCPLNDATRNLIDKDVLENLPKQAVVINVARQGIMDTAALREQLGSGRLGGAALDVFEQRPVPPDDPLWQTPNLIITPYLAARYHERAKEFERFAEDQVKRYVARLPLINLVDWGKIQ